MTQSSNTGLQLNWRTMREQDLAAVNQIAAEVHLDYPESPAVFAERLMLFEGGCWVAADTQLRVQGYAISHPALLGQPPTLDCLLRQLPAAANCLYLHDVALRPGVRGAGLGASLLDLMRQQARIHRLTQLALVAVNGSAAYWQRQGFQPYGEGDTSLMRKLGSYDSSARYLRLPLE